jgi:hypothetical protein
MYKCNEYKWSETNIAWLRQSLVTGHLVFLPKIDQLFSLQFKKILFLLLSCWYAAAVLCREHMWMRFLDLLRWGCRRTFHAATYKSTASVFVRFELFVFYCRHTRRVSPYSSGLMCMTFGTLILPSSLNVMAGKSWNERAICLNNV